VGVSVLIQITPQLRILVAIDAIDGRKGIDSLAQLCREKLAADPFSGCLFIFRSRSGKAIRILTYDGQGFWIATKRLSKGRFKWWPTDSKPAKTSGYGSRARVAARERIRKTLPGLAFRFRLWHTGSTCRLICAIEAE
jgi:transposase